MITFFGGQPVRRALHLVFLSLLLIGGVLFISPVAADTTDGEDTHAGIVIQFDDGSLGEYCVDLGDDGTATGEEVLRATGLDVTVEYQGMGAAICKVENDGCNFPAQDCFCECTMLPGEPCTYWAYHRLEGNAWIQSPMGSSSTSVTGGSVEGWSWGTGSVSQGTAPPVRTFDQLCEAILATATPTVAPPTATATTQPSNTATATVRPSATATLAPSNTPAPTGTLLPTVTTAGLPSATVAPSATNVALPTNTSVLPTATGTRAPTSTNLPLATATLAIASPTASVVASATVGASPTLQPTATVTATTETTVVPTLAPPVVNAPTPTVAGIAVQPTLGTVATAAPPLVADTDSGSGSDLWIYAVFGLVVVGLLGVIGFVWYRRG